ncbi:hypothetical protein [Marinagarivorans algicola]|uniref:hypothetical protein n=1 Tax=Marinagarivorans algicola TaxID=1513270 RepID=UPI0006B6595E|nr:hypothetical protein [Marinagarivorans algicola]
MKGNIKFLSKAALVIAVFAQTSAADTVLPIIGSSGLNEPLYLSICGLGLLILGMKNKPSI